MRGLREKWMDPSTRIVFQDSDGEREQIQFGPVKSRRATRGAKAKRVKK